MSSVTFCHNIPKTFSSRFLCRAQKRLCTWQQEEKDTKKTYQQKIYDANKNEGQSKSIARNAELLTKMCHYCYDKDKIDENNFEKRMLVVKELSRIIKDEIDPSASVYSFGSSSNGFGSKSADLDVTVFVNIKVKGHVWTRVMRRSRKFNHLYFVNARVPVVNFKHIETGIVGDVSFSNGVAVYNTILLKKYSQIDERIQPLVYTVKQLVKHWKICGNAGRYISSYAYTLMVIYFLQQTNPPLLPSLQELHDDHQPPNKRAFGHNVWFYNEDIHSLKKVWNHTGSNTMTTGELLLSFFDFYLHRFNYGTHAVCIKSTKPIKKRSQEYYFKTSHC